MAQSVHARRFTLTLMVVALALAALLGLPASQAHASEIFVSVLGSDTAGNGSVGNPYATVQHAVDIAVAGDEVHVGGGTFNGDVTMKNRVSLLGAGSTETTLAGTGTWPVISATSIDSGTTISGITITGGGSASGGGVFCSSSSPSIINCTISGNSGGNSGGGIYCLASSPTITGTTISGNTAADGGGVYCSSSSPTITGTTISGNTAGLGGGIYCDSSSAPTITNCTISLNIGTWGGGVYSRHESSPTITKSTISGNTAMSGGGVLASSPLTVTNSTIIGNSAKSSPAFEGKGGGINCDYALPTVTNNVISGNTASSGGGVYCGDSWSTVTNNFISGNTASSGGGISCEYDSSTVTNNVISGNTASSGGGINCSYASPTVINNTIVGNLAASGGGINCANPTSLPTIVNCIIWDNGDDLSHCSATYSCIKNVGAASGLGNITVPPSFVGSATGDFHLEADSPCIDAATSTGAPPTDKDGAGRPQGVGYDMGAYEFNVPVVTYTITPSMGANGSISPSTPQTVNSGGSKTFAVTANSSYHIADVLVDGKSVGPVASHTFTNVTANHTISATFAADVALAPVYRFLNNKMGTHFYTASEAEYNDVNDNKKADFTYEGIAYKVSPAAATGAIPVYRFLNKKLPYVHFYTATESEMNNVKNNDTATWGYEGVAYYVWPAKTGTQTPVWRFFKPKQAVHFYTATESEMTNVKNTMTADYTYEGVAYFVEPYVAQ